MSNPLSGLIAATHTPFAEDGSLNVSVVAAQAEHLLSQGVRLAFIGGSTGESHSLTLTERLQLAERWRDVTRGSPLQFIVHVGSNCLADARTLAAQAQQLGAVAISALAPSYFKPTSVDALVACCRHIAEAAPETPFYFYDIPSMTGVSLPMPEFLEQAGHSLPSLAGLKFTNNDLMAYQSCRAVAGGRYNLLWGIDELLLAALACGATGAVGSTYNFAAPLYTRILQAFQAGDFPAARRDQLRSIQLVQLLCQRGYMASARALMQLQGIPVGPPRLPHARLTSEQLQSLRQDLEAFGPF